MQIELRHINKSFGPVHANKDINLTFREGRVIGILGENGAGKSTLMKILSGFQPADSGDILIDGQPVAHAGPQAAIAAGIGMLQQDPLDVAAFSVIDNFMYGQTGGFFLPRRRARKDLMRLCEQFGFDLHPETPIETLSIAQRQQLEIIRLLALGVKTLILDEPTTGISAEQKDILFNTLRDLTQEGMTVLLVSHKLEDVIALCNEIAVLRAGEVVGTREMPATRQEMVQMMFGQDLTMQSRKARDFAGVPVIFSLDDLSLHDERLRLRNIQLQVHAGEIIGLAGLDGSGQELFMRACAGLLRPDSGRIHLRDADMTGKPYRVFMREGVIFGAAGRLEEGLVAGLTLTEHIALLSETAPVINWQRARQHTQQRIKHYDVRGKSHDMIETLSGGNQQRVLMAMLPDDPVLMVLEQPTRGLDVDSAAWIWDQLLDRCQRDAALIFSSADLDELVNYSDRIIVFYAGRLAVVTNPRSMSVNDLGYLIGGEPVQGITFDSA